MSYSTKRPYKISSLSRDSSLISKVGSGNYALSTTVNTKTKLEVSPPISTTIV